MCSTFPRPRSRESLVVAVARDAKNERAFGNPLAAALRRKRLDDEACVGVGDRVRLTHLVLEGSVSDPEAQASGLHDLRTYLRDRR